MLIRVITCRPAPLAVAASLAATAALLVLPAGPAAATGTSYWADNTNSACSDTVGTAGTTATPTCTISAAAKKATQPGDTVHVVAGSYQEQVNMTGSGTSTDPISIVADSPDVTLLGATDLSTATWTPTATTAWTTPVALSAAPGQVLLDGTALAKATSATTTTAGQWFYDVTARQLSVDVGGTDPSAGHTVQVVRNYGVNLNGNSYVQVRGFTASGQGLAGFHSVNATGVSFVADTATGSRSYGIHVERTTGATITHATTSGNVSVGIRLSADTDTTLSESVSHDNDFHGVSVQGSTGTVVNAVRSYGNGDAVTANGRVANGIDVSFLDSPSAPRMFSTATVVENSTTYGNEDSGMEAYTGSDGTVFRRNLTYDNGDHGIDNLAATNTVAVSNTVVGNATAGINFEGGSTGATTRDNIAVDNGATGGRTVGQIRVDPQSLTGSTIERDLVRGQVLVAWNSVNYTSLTDLMTDTGQEAHGLSGDPGFVDLAGRDLRLAASSRAVDAAFSDVAQWQSSDHDGNMPFDDPGVTNTGTGPDSVADLGALERLTSSAQPPPPPGQPVAVGTLSPAQGTAPLDVQVDGSGSNSPGHTITSASWDCGNGTTVPAGSGTCSYPTAGSYTATLTVIDDSGATAQWTGAVTVSAPVVTPPPPSDPPPTDPPPSGGNPRPSTPATVTARLTGTPGTGTAPMTVTLDASGSSVSDGTAVTSYTFSCGTGSTAPAQGAATTRCTYPAAGSYTATVTARDAAGDQDTASTTVSVTAPTSVQARMTAAPARGWAPMRIRLDASRSTTSDGSAIAAYRFTCGNGTTHAGTSAVALCRYRKPGRYLARVTVADAAGHTGTALVRVWARADVAPTAVLVVSTHRPRPGHRIVLDGTLSRDPDHTPVARFRFACGNGVRTSTQRSPRTTCVYRSGRHTVQMWVTDTAGHTSHVTTVIAVRQARRAR